MKTKNETTTATVDAASGGGRRAGTRGVRNSRILSPGGLAARAVLIVVVYGLCELAGWREATTFLSGSQAAGGWSATVWKGVAFLLAYHGAVLLAPILLIAAGLLAAWRRLALPGPSVTPART
jgi:hypothetical protein